VIVEDDRGWQEVARYVHLNPVRIAILELNKRQQQASRAGLVARAKAEFTAERLRLLRGYRWSSYRGYAGYCAPLAWLSGEPLDRLCGGRTEPERRAALRQYTEQPVRTGAIEPLWERLVGGLVLGTEAFAQRLRRQAQGNRREQAPLKALERPPSWSRMVPALERTKGEPWADFSGRHGD
jgi:hypothetical protein